MRHQAQGERDEQMEVEQHVGKECSDWFLLVYLRYRTTVRHEITNDGKNNSFT